MLQPTAIFLHGVRRRSTATTALWREADPGPNESKRCRASLAIAVQDRWRQLANCHPFRGLSCTLVPFLGFPRVWWKQLLFETMLVTVVVSGAISPANAGTVQTLDGSLLCGQIHLEAPDALLVTPSNAPPVRVALSNLLRADFTNPTNLPPPLSPRLKPLAMDEERGALPEPWQNLDLGRLEEP